MACCVWDFTFHVGGPGWTKDTMGGPCENMDNKYINEFVNKYCKKWCYQLEKGGEGAYHYQGRISLKSKMRLGGLVKLLPGAHFSITSNNCKGNSFYVEKEDTRVCGPWKDSDEPPKKKPFSWNVFWENLKDLGRSPY